MQNISDVKFCIPSVPYPSCFYQMLISVCFLKLRVILNDLGEKGELLGFIFEDRDV